MSSLAEKYEWSDSSVVEWERLDNLARRHDRRIKMVYNKAIITGMQNTIPEIRETVIDAVVETAATSADKYELNFDSTRPRWADLVDELTGTLVKVVDNGDRAKNKVKQILPEGLSLADRRNRLDVYGLDARAAVRVERLRQSGASEQIVRSTRIDLSLQRGNLLALTEVNRIINATLETLWIENLRGVSKARRKKVQYGGEWFAQTSDGGRVITSLRGIPSRAVKQVLTRRDNRVCDYCLPLEGTTALLGQMFDTQYGVFKYPPFHPRCRCYMIVSY